MSFKINKKSGPGRTFSKGGFTLLEILLVVGIIAILAGIVIVAINPGRQLAQTRNAERRSDIRQIKSAMEQFYIDKGYYPASTTLSANNTLMEICDTGATSSPSGVTCTDMLDLSELVPVYITAIPKDPQATTTNSAGYKVVKDATNKLVMTAPQAELEVNIAIGTSTAATAVASTLGDGLIAHYLMNDDSDNTTVTDTTGDYNGVSEANTSAKTTAGKINKALTFNGSSDGVRVSDLGPSHPLVDTSYGSISAWVKYTGTQDDGMLIAGWEYTANFSLCYNSANNGLKMRFYDGLTGLDVVSPNAYNDGEWHLLVGTYDATLGSDNVNLYVDGTLVKQGDYSQPITTFSDQFSIGAMYLEGTPRYELGFIGSIDDVRLYNRVLTQAEVTALYNGGAGTEAE